MRTKLRSVFLNPALYMYITLKEEVPPPGAIRTSDQYLGVFIIDFTQPSLPTRSTVDRRKTKHRTS